MSKFLGITLIVVALAVALVPQFTTCESQGKSMTIMGGMSVPMKCKWTAEAELVASVPLFAVGAMMALSQRRETKRYLSILGIAVISVPTSLIGVCDSMMICHTVMKPTLISAGGLTSVIGW
jgi:hypothetical protein